ncbi:13775_t:CDS:2, partial [Funneliformis caledonium]
FIEVTTSMVLNFEPGKSKNVGFVTNKSNDCILLQFESDGFTTPDEKVKELLKKLTETKYLYALKLLFENPINQFSPQVLRDSLVALSDPTPFDYYSRQSAIRLELHLRIWVAVLEQICFTQMRLSKGLRDKIYNSLASFSEIHRKTTQVLQEGIDNNYNSDFNQFNKLNNNEEDRNILKKRNYNIDFLLVHLRDTLHSLRDDETWTQELMRRTKDLLKTVLNVSTGILSVVAPGITTSSDNCSFFSKLAQLRKGLTFKYPVAVYYVDWRIMLIIRHNIIKWSEDTEKVISKKFGEMILMEYLWSYLEREWNNLADKTMLDSQTKFDKISNNVSNTLRNIGNLINDLAGNEPLTFPHTLWFGILDLAHNLIKSSDRTATHGLSYYLAIESLNKAPSSFIQFKAIEILLHLYNINSKLFTIVELDFNQYSQKLNENNSKAESDNFQNLLMFVKKNYLIDEKEECLDQNTFLMEQEGYNSCNIIDIIADTMTCPISHEPVDNLCILKCQHEISLYNLRKLKQKNCPKCREIIEETGRILPSDQVKVDQNESDSDTSEVDLVLTKKKQSSKEITFNSSKSLQSIFQRTSKKQHPAHQNVIRELLERNYEEAKYWCNEFLKIFPKSYSMRCILAYIYKNLNHHEQAYLNLNKAIGLNPKNPIAYFIQGEIFFKEKKYIDADFALNNSIYRKAKFNNIHLIIGNISLHYCNSRKAALQNYNIELQSNPNNYLCLKNCAYIYEKQENYLNTLEMLRKLLNINENDSLILCYYGEILMKLGRYVEAELYYTKANNIDPENIHILIKRAITYIVLQKYDKSFLDLNRVLKLDPLNTLAHYYKGLICYLLNDTSDALAALTRCTELDSNDDLAKAQLYYLEFLRDKDYLKDIIITKVNQISNIDEDKSLLLIRCKIYIELEMYEKALKDSYNLFNKSREDISIFFPLKKYLSFWSYLCNYCSLNDYESKSYGIVDNFNTYMFKGKRCYFLSNLENIDDNNNLLFRDDHNSLSGRILHVSESSKFFNPQKFPKLSSFFFLPNFVAWKICIERILSKECTVIFVVEAGYDSPQKHQRHQEHKLNYDKISEIIGLGWIEYELPFELIKWNWIRPSIKVENGTIDMKIDYVRLNSFERGPIYLPKMGHLLPTYKSQPNVPEAFEDKYFSKKEMENFFELKEILNYL